MQASTISSTAPIRPSGMRDRLCVKSASDKKARGCGVSVIPGEIVFTRMLSAAASIATVRARPSMPPFDAA